MKKVSNVMRTLGSSAHSEGERDLNDFYATDPIAAKWLVKLEGFSGPIWEPACGHGHLSNVFEKEGFIVKSTDLISRGYGEGGVDFLSIDNMGWDGDIITNPPFKYAIEFVIKALEIVQEGRKVAMFLKVQFLEGKARKALFTNYPPARIWVSSSRIDCAKGGDFELQSKLGGGAQAYCWYIWEKGFKGDTIIKWFN